MHRRESFCFCGFVDVYLCEYSTQRCTCTYQTMTGALPSVSFVTMFNFKQSSTPCAPPYCTHFEDDVAINGLVEYGDVRGVISVHLRLPVGACSVYGMSLNVDTPYDRLPVTEPNEVDIVCDAVHLMHAIKQSNDETASI